MVAHPATEEPTPPANRLLQLVGRYRKRIAGVLGLELLGQCAWIAEPFVFGRVIDALIAHHYREQFHLLLLQLSVWIGVFALNSGSGVVRRFVAERVHSALYRDVCTSLTRASAEDGTPASQTAARAELFRELIVFLDERAPAVVAGVINVGGSVAALALFDYRIALACSLVGIPVVIAKRIVDTRVSALQRDERDLREKNVDVFATRDPEAVAAHFRDVSRARVSIASWGALNFGTLRLFMLAIFISVLFIAIDLDGFTTGAIYSIVSYLWTFVTYAEDVPVVLEARASIRDLARRLEQPPSESGAAFDATTDG
jgi:ABC-type multidrug transport system fused ATPase/permease subunit